MGGELGSDNASEIGKKESRNDGTTDAQAGEVGAEEKNGKKYEHKKHDFRPKNEKQTDRDRRNFMIKGYDKNYKKLLIIPSAVTVIAVLILAFNFLNTGEFFQTDVSIKGGATVTVLKNHEDVTGLEAFLTESLDTPVSVRTLSEAGINRGLVLDAGVQTDEEVERFLTLIQEETGPLSEGEYSIQVIGSSLGANFFKAVMISILMAFFFMAAVVFIFFRISTGSWIIIPSLFIIWTVIADIICTFAVVSLLQIKVSTAGLSAFLLLIGFSVDTDILLTMRMLKSRQEKLFDRIMTAARTGIFMTLTGMAAISAGLAFTQSETIRQIMLILVIGLAFDLMHTWLTNTGILRWYMERNTYGEK